jgi:RNA polymerase sigma-70 factor (ECF subfamily)
MGAPALNLAACDDTSGEDVVKRVLAGDTALCEILIRRYNHRFYRVARSILRDEAHAEDVIKEANVCLQHPNQFAGEAKFSKWLNSDTRVIPTFTPNTRDPERQAYDQKLTLVLERSIEALPEIYRMVFVLRSVEELSVAETAGCLEMGPEAVKTRLHRAKSLPRKTFHRAPV